MKKELSAQDWGLMIGRELHSKENGCDILEGVTINAHKQIMLHCKNGLYNTEFIECKPFLRTLDQMTEDEKREYKESFYHTEATLLQLSYDSDGLIQEDCLFYSTHPGHFPIREPQKFDWLTRKGFDIRGWIEAGLAVKKDS